MTVVINGDTGITSPADSLSGNLTFSSTGQRITGDFSNATHANRVMFQTSTSNGATNVAAIPNGTSTQGQFLAYGGTDPANTSVAQFLNIGTEVSIRASAAGTGTYLPMTFFIGGSERLRIDTSGNVGIGTSSPAAANKLQVLSTSADQGIAVGGTTKQLRFSYDSTGNYGQINCADWGTAQTDLSIGGLDLLFKTGVYSLVERMRIDSSGNLLLGTTDSSLTSGSGIKILPTALGTVETYSTNSNSNYLMYSTGASAYRFYVGWGGTINATSTTITGISDQRLKENIRDLDDGLDKVLALKPRKFDWKEGKGQGIKDARGFIAQEFETVFPDMIEEWLDPAPEGEEPYKAVNANLIPTLVKAIQEQQAIIEQLRADVAQLKGQA